MWIIGVSSVKVVRVSNVRVIGRVYRKLSDLLESDSVWWKLFSVIGLIINVSIMGDVGYLLFCMK